VDILVGLEDIVLLSRKDSEGVRAEVVTLGLEHVGRKNLTPVPIEEGESGTESGSRNTPKDGLSDHAPPSGLSLVDSFVEEIIEEQALQLVVLLISSSDVAEENTLDDAATSPHRSDASVVQVPADFLGGLPHEHEALSVRDDLGRIEGLFEVIDELLLVTLEWLPLRTVDHFASTFTLSFDRREATGEDGFADECDGSASFQSSDRSPFAGTLLACFVENLSDHGLTIVVLKFQDVGGNFDEERVEDTLIPFFENPRNLILMEAKATLEDIICLGNQLHIAIFDTVVDHLDVVTGTSLSDPVTAGNTIDLSSGGLEDLLDGIPGRGATTGHKRRSVSSTFFTTRDTGADEKESLGLKIFAAADRVGVVGVSTIDDDITLFKKRSELVDEDVNGLAGLNEEDDLARRFKLRNQFLDRVSTDDLGAFSLILEEVVDFFDCAVESTNDKTLVVHVQDKILTHDGQADKANISNSLRHFGMAEDGGESGSGYGGN